MSRTDTSIVDEYPPVEDSADIVDCLDNGVAKAECFWDNNMHLSYLSLYDVNCPFSQNDLPLKST